MNGWFDDFDSLYEMYDNDEPELRIENTLYCVQQYPTEKNPRNLHVSVTDLTKVPKDGTPYDEKYETDSYEFENSFEFINNFRLANGKTIAEMMCDANGWNYARLPVYPNWLSPLGEVKDIKVETDNKSQEDIKKADLISKEFWEKDKKEMLAANDKEGLALYKEIEKEFPDDDGE